MSIRRPTVADRADIRTIINQNIGLMGEPNNAPVSAARVVEILTAYDTWVHVDDAIPEVDGVITVQRTPELWLMRILFCRTGIGQTRFLQAFLDMQQAVGQAALAQNIPLVGSTMHMPIVAFVANLLQAQRQAGGWRVRFTNSKGDDCPANDPDAQQMHSRGTPQQFLAGIQATRP